MTEKVQKKNIYKGFWVTQSENEIILAVQRYHGMQEFSQLMLLLVQAEHKRLGLEKA